MTGAADASARRIALSGSEQARSRSALPEVDVELNRRQFIEVASGAAAVLPMAGQGAASDRDDPLGVRRDFPVVRDGLYLNSAYITPVPQPVADAGRAFAERKAATPFRLDEMLKKT